MLGGEIEKKNTKLEIKKKVLKNFKGQSEKYLALLLFITIRKCQYLVVYNNNNYDIEK
jgi:hypothetical protein